MTNPEKYKKKVVDFIKSSKPRSSSHKLISQDDFLDGVVAQVEYTEGGNSEKQWVIATSKHMNYAENESQLIQQMNVAYKSFSTRWVWLNQIFNIGGIIALILVGTGSYMAIVNPDSQIPEYLKTMLLTVMGFYFGGYVSHGLSKRHDAET